MDKQKEFLDQINTKQFTVQVLDISRRLVSHWQEEQLIEFYHGEGWRKFSITEVLWIDIIATLRAFGMSNGHIREVKTQLFKSGQPKMKVLEKAIFDVLIHQTPIYLAIDRQRNLQVLNDLEYINLLKEKEGVHLITLSMNKIVGDNFNQLFSTPKFNAMLGLSKQEQVLMEMVRNKQYTSLTIKKKNGALDRIEGTERMDTEKRIFELLRGGKFQDIVLKQENGKIVCVNRTIKQKL